MTKVVKQGANSRAVALKTDGNPEGKGVSGFLRDWDQSSPRGVAAKPDRQLLAELFTSMFALSATFRYQPVVGRPNYLYRVNGRWSLSLIAPEEWSQERRAAFAGTLVLQPDMTWTIAPSDQLAENASMANAFSRFYDAFMENLDTDRTLEEILPLYVQSMPYYQRLYASALSRSMRTAIDLGSQASVSCRHWRALVPQQQQIMLSAP